MHAQGIKWSVCPSMVVIVIQLLLSARKSPVLGDLGIWATSKANESIRIGGKLASVCFKSFCTSHERHKWCFFAQACRPYLLNIGPCAICTCAKLVIWQVMVVSRHYAYTASVCFLWILLVTNTVIWLVRLKYLSFIENHISSVENQVESHVIFNLFCLSQALGIVARSKTTATVRHC